MITYFFEMRPQRKIVMKNLITSKEASEELGVSVRRVLALINAGKLPAKKLGRDWVIRKSDLGLVRVRKPGRPAKK
ncbi:MAG: helix-turn-helix domain-containing protein [Desulfobacterales bacterium]